MKGTGILAKKNLRFFYGKFDEVKIWYKKTNSGNKACFFLPGLVVFKNLNYQIHIEADKNYQIWSKKPNSGSTVAYWKFCEAYAQLSRGL